MLQLVGIAVDAISVGGLETCIQLPGMGLAMDIGRCPPSAVRQRTVLFTHAHMDHMGGVALHCATRSLMHMKPPRYVVPHENEAAFHELLGVWRRLDRSDLACEVVPLGPGEALDLGKGITARPFRSPHRVPCQGYGLWRRRRRLRSDLRGKDSSEIKAARARGETVNEEWSVPEVAFTGDSLIEVVEREAVVRTARLLIMEVTFIDDRVSVAQARSKGHIHLDEVVERAALFENQAILFTHLSARYRPAEAREILARRLPPGLKERVHLLV